MRRRAALAWLGLLMPGLAAAQQPAAPRPAAPRRANPPPARQAAPAAPPRAAVVPPPPPVPALPPPPPPIPLPAGMQALPTGGWRILLMSDATAFPPAFHGTLVAIAQRLGGTDGRVTVIAQAPAPGLEPSFARRLSLERALSVKNALTAAGVPATRIDLRPMGRQPQGADVIDIIPPGAPR